MKKIGGVVRDVMEECYRRAAVLEPGSEGAEAAEHAITLTLSEDRDHTSAKHLLADVLADGRKQFRRGTARRLRAEQACGDHAVLGIPTGLSRGFVCEDTPESIVVAADLADSLHVHSEAVSEHGPRVLDGMLADETVDETAAALGRSLATVDRTRRKLRDRAREIGLAA